MRVSNRHKILESVVEIVQRDGIKALTFDAVAEETGLTRGGLLYHFPSREDLVLAAHQHLADQWAAEMQSFLTEGDQAQIHAARARAYILANIRAARRAELLMMLECAADPKLSAIWTDVTEQWAPAVPQGDDPQDFARFIGRIAADGLWMLEALSSEPLDPSLKQKVTDYLLSLQETV